MKSIGFAPTHLSYKKLQKETLRDIQLSSLTFLFTINAFQIYFLISLNEVTFMMIYQIFVKHTSLFILGTHFFVYLIAALGAQQAWTLTFSEIVL